MKNTLMFLLVSLMLALTACGGGQTTGGENGGRTDGTNGTVMENSGRTDNGSLTENGGSNDRDDSLMDDARDAVDDAGRSVRGALDDAGDAMDRAF